MIDMWQRQLFASSFLTNLSSKSNLVQRGSSMFCHPASVAMWLQIYIICLSVCDPVTVSLWPRDCGTVWLCVYVWLYVYLFVWSCTHVIIVLWLGDPVVMCLRTMGPCDTVTLWSSVSVTLCILVIVWLCKLPSLWPCAHVIMIFYDHILETVC